MGEFFHEGIGACAGGCFGAEDGSQGGGTDSGGAFSEELSSIDV
jgi:hypothetical protein